MQKSKNTVQQKDNQTDKQKNVRMSNIFAAKSVSELIRTSLGPRGMDKLIQNSRKEVTISNDGATIMEKLSVQHPAAKMMVDLSKAQDISAGDGTTTVVVLAGALLNSCIKLLEKGIHPTTIAESFSRASKKAIEIVESISINLDLGDRNSLIRSAKTSLNSKVVSNYSDKLAPIAVDSILKIIDPKTATNVDLKDIRIIKKLGGTIDDSELVDGIVLNQRITNSSGGPTKIENAKIGIIQYQISPPKPNIDTGIVIKKYVQMDRVISEEKKYIAKILKPIRLAKCNVLLIQKSILRDAVTDLSLHYLAKAKIMVVKDIERDEIEFICRTIDAKPVASPETFVQEKCGTAKLVEQIDTGDEKLVIMRGVPNSGKTVTVLLRGSNTLMLDEAERSLHDALCAIRSLVKRKAVITGGGAPEIEVSMRLTELAKTIHGVEQQCFKAFAEAFEVIPFTLAENAGLNPVEVVTNLRNSHKLGNKTFGINVVKGEITDLANENVLEPLLVKVSAIRLAVECVIMILKIDDMVATR
eukprot:TRINITY_DN3774_c0_g1_i1.p1 TRINITY_DN3774_c0_g1~~TRINITY_DN3774_c0_g1_i1.p1  ORF type:complete len:529 (-),score=190.37 TRINITY_DN3774_c0_g1_i1:59-1645(-)